MKLYNIYTNLILENIKQKIELFEGVSGNLIDTILAGDNQTPGKHYRVAIRYRNAKGEVSNQFIEINQKNISTAGNNLIDARVLSKNNVVLGDNVYKKFNIDNIEDFKITKVAYYKPGDNMRTDGGNDSKNIVSVNNWADYDYKFAPSTIKQKERKAAQIGANQNAPTTAPIQQTKPVNNQSAPAQVAKPIVKTTTNGTINNPEVEPEEIGSEEEEEEFLNTK